MVDLWLKTLADLRSPKIWMLMAIPLVAALILVSLLGYGLFGFFIYSDFITQSPMVLQMQESMSAAEQSIGAIPLIGGLILWVLGLVVALVAGVIGFILGSYLILLFAMVITGFMTDALVKAVRDLDYPGLTYQGHGSLGGMLWKLTRFGLLMLLLFVLTLPMLFIPLVNLLWFWLLGFLFFRYSVVLDVGQVILPQALFERHKALSDWTPTLSLAGIFTLSLLPLMSLVVPVLAVIAQAHYYFDLLSRQPKAPVATQALTKPYS
ncbi:MAG: EI24 domain-containing protein [Thiotrichales bacterium]|nr:EI24 domain-containing protein [Thiotrichales bacterium]